MPLEQVSVVDDSKDDPSSHIEVVRTLTAPVRKWKVSKTGDGDTALALFDNLDQIQEPIDPAEEKRLVWKIDFMILPYLAVCYMFFFVRRSEFFSIFFNFNFSLLWSGKIYSHASFSNKLVYIKYRLTKQRSPMRRSSGSKRISIWSERTTAGFPHSSISASWDSPFRRTSSCRNSPLANTWGLTSSCGEFCSWRKPP